MKQETPRHNRSVLSIIIGIVLAIILVFAASSMAFYIFFPASDVAINMDMFFLNWLGYLPFSKEAI